MAYAEVSIMKYLSINISKRIISIGTQSIKEVDIENVNEK